MMCFLRKLCILAALPGLLSAATFNGRVFLDQNRNGQIDAGENGLAGIVVSDGHAVVKSAADGRFSLDSAEAKPLLWYCRPSDHEPVGSFWCWGDAGKENDFGLVASPQEREFTFMQFTDSHLSSPARLQEFSEHLKTLPISLAFAVNTGDLVASSDTLLVDKAVAQYDAYQAGIAAFPLTLLHVIGNHEHAMSSNPDRDLNHEFYGKGLYRHRFGPTYYCFDWAGIRFYALDGTQMHKGLGYREALGEEQLAWLEKDLALLKPGTPIILLCHEPQAGIPGHSSGLRDQAQLAKLLKGHNLQAAFCGHLHNNYEARLNDAPLFVTGALSGAWWGGPNSDGSPQGYRLISVKDGVFQRTAYFNREGHNAIARIAPSAGEIGSGKQTLTVSVLDYGKPMELTASVRNHDVALAPVMSSREPLWSYWTLSFDSATWPDNLYTIDFKALQDGKESTSSTRCLLINGNDDKAFAPKYDYVLHFTYVRADADAELLINDQVIASIAKGRPCGRNEKGSVTIPRDIMRRMNALSIRTAPGQTGRVAISHVTIKYQREDKKTVTISDPRYYGHSSMSVNAAKPESAGKRYFAVMD
ncbi:MAG: metallophosphoesterase [Lentisphaeria bacterium]|nr:metallophosphoesterase [Lentisphaeria bacterium]